MKIYRSFFFMREKTWCVYILLLGRNFLNREFLNVKNKEEVERLFQDNFFTLEFHEPSFR